MNKTDYYMDNSNSKKINQIQKIEKPVKNKNNYLFINNKFKYNNPNDNNVQERKYLRNINLNNFLNMKSGVRKKIKNKIILDLDKEVSEDDEDELSEIANKINIYNESKNKNKNSKSKLTI